MKIIEYRNAKDIDIYFPQYNWTFKHGRYSHFKEGSVICPYEKRFRGIGYLGEGEYKTRENNKETRCYHEWMKILQRCYDSSYQEKYPTYKDCIICEEWMCYQNFAEWYYNNYYTINNEKMEIDKDILCKGNKLYNPQTCIIVPQRINKLFTKSNKLRGDLPIGVYYNKQNKKYRSQISKIENGKKQRVYLGLYNTPQEAFESYKKAKENYIKQVADEYKPYIPKELYDAMYNYKVEITD